MCVCVCATVRAIAYVSTQRLTDFMGESQLYDFELGVYYVSVNLSSVFSNEFVYTKTLFFIKVEDE